MKIFESLQQDRQYSRIAVMLKAQEPFFKQKRERERERAEKSDDCLTGALETFLLPTDLDMRLFWMAATSSRMATITTATNTTNTIGTIPKRGSSGLDSDVCDSDQQKNK